MPVSQVVTNVLGGGCVYLNCCIWCRSYYKPTSSLSLLGPVAGRGVGQGFSEYLFGIHTLICLEGGGAKEYLSSEYNQPIFWETTKVVQTGHKLVRPGGLSVCVLRSKSTSQRSINRTADWLLVLDVDGHWTWCAEGCTQTVPFGWFPDGNFWSTNKENSTGECDRGCE